MRAPPRRLLSYASFVALLLLDAVSLVSFLFVQLLGVPIALAWIAAGIVVTMAMPALLRWTDRVFGTTRNDSTIPQAGESFL